MWGKVRKRTLDTKTLVQQLAQVERVLRLRSRQQTEHDHATVASETRDVLRPVVLSDEVDDDVDTVLQYRVSASVQREGEG
jgi:hypothetical protein